MSHRVVAAPWLPDVLRAGASEDRPLLVPQPVFPCWFLLFSILLVNVKAVLCLITQAEAAGLQLPRQQSILCRCHTSYS